MRQFVEHPLTLPVVTEEVERLTEIEKERKLRDYMKVQLAVDWAYPDMSLTPRDLD